MKRRRTQQAITPDEQIARYAYVLGTVPASVADKAYAAAFARLSQAQREDVVGQLSAELPDAPDEAASVDPDAFAQLMRDLLARDALVRIRDGVVVAAAFVGSPAIVAYFTTGAGSVTMDHQPPWIHQLAGHETAPVDGGRTHHRHGVPGILSRDHENSGDSRDW
ncbi:hypothetical protein JNB63_09685 [Microbacterium trichothecenolyticum]|uniref:hypothetical protein n=1 Tax=Microbacterium trichothecenolyticum TaxID=69370 RepID=UPI001C6EFEC9|nr:hypothetical protein [Microbacterium trichothecenolyticum]MBW9120365.1 hypothetical protein [Microbacterium trichothecenolyticum]